MYIIFVLFMIICLKANVCARSYALLFVSERVYVSVRCYQSYDLYDYILCCCCCCSLHIIFTSGPIFILARMVGICLNIHGNGHFVCIPNDEKAVTVSATAFVFVATAAAAFATQVLIDKTLYEIQIIIRIKRRIEIAALEKEKTKAKYKWFSAPLQITDCLSCVFGH